MSRATHRRVPLLGAIGAAAAVRSLVLDPDESRTNVLAGARYSSRLWRSVAGYR